MTSIPKDTNMQELYSLISELKFFEITAEDKLVATQHKGRGNLKVQFGESQCEILGSGNWIGDNFNNVAFNFSYRMIFVNKKDEISIEHLRYGKETPVYLCRLKSSGKNVFESIQPHLCNKDLYQATLVYTQTLIKLIWNIKDPKKDMHLEYKLYK